MGNTLHTHTLPQIPHEQRRQEEANLESEHQQSSDEEDRDGFTCEICIEPTSYPAKRFGNGGDCCSHPFCTDCMIKYITAKLDDGNAGRVACPAVACGRALDPRAWAPRVGPQLFVRWCDLLCEDAIAGWGKCYCPYRNCGALIVNECGGSVGKSRCPQCRRWFCFGCERVWHAGFGCEENGEMRDRNDVAFGRLAELRKWMRCPRCRHFVELRDGCKIVKCRCGISFCYKCGQQVHKHWCHCDSTSRCCEYCFRFCIVFLILTLASVLLLWVVMQNKKWNHKRA